MAETALVVAPGRGTYNATELGYLSRYHAGERELVHEVDDYVRLNEGRAVSDLDAMDTFRGSVHGLGRNASALIYACALSDFAAIAAERFDIVAITGNSMGWYLALAAAGVTRSLHGGIGLVDQMASLMDEHGVGGQLLYPLVDEQWRPVPERTAAVNALLASSELFESIRLGGSVVLAGSDRALRHAEAELPAVDGRFPARLPRHAAFHTPLLAPISDRAEGLLDTAGFQTPDVALIDGRGEIWQPGSDPAGIRDYTLHHQVQQTYDFTRAITVGVREFAPERIIVLGPGPAMGAPVLQTLMSLEYRGLATRESWQLRQQRDPLVLAMGIDTQRARVTAREN